MSAPNWERGHVLTWSGKWHIPHPAFIREGGQWQRAYCGSSGMAKSEVPHYVKRLVKISDGETTAPTCKLCERAAANAADAADGA